MSYIKQQHILTPERFNSPSPHLHHSVAIAYDRPGHGEELELNVMWRMLGLSVIATRQFYRALLFLLPFPVVQKGQPGSSDGLLLWLCPHSVAKFIIRAAHHFPLYQNFSIKGCAWLFFRETWFMPHCCTCVYVRWCWKLNPSLTRAGWPLSHRAISPAHVRILTCCHYRPSK